MVRRIVFVTAATLALLAWAGQGAARAQSEEIRDYTVDITIQGNGSLVVVEQIAYDFGSTEHHGIFRDIPVRFHYDDRFDRVYPVEVSSVTSTGGASADYKVQRQGANLDIKIGDPDETVTGEHTYTIAYTVRGALNGFPGHDELYWNATGNGWSVPIDRASVRVSAPAAIMKVACFAGPTGSGFPCTASSFSGSSARFDQSTIGPYNGVTVVVALPKGAVPAPHAILDERWSLARAFATSPVTVSGSLGLLLLLGFGLGRLMWVEGRDRRAVGSAVDIAYATATEDEQRVPLFERGSFPVEYVPPEDIRPGQVGTLIDETAHVLDVTATIVDLAVRGYLRIEEIPKRGLFGKPDWRLVQLKEADDELLPYERRLLKALFEGGDPDDVEDALDIESVVPPRPDEVPAERVEPLATVRLSTLRKHFAARLAKVQDALYADVVKRGWFADRPDRVRQKWTGRGWILFLVGAGLLYLAAWRTHLALIALPLPVAGLVLVRGGHRMPRRTPKGTGMVRRVLGFRTYIETAEADEARFAERANLFSQYLPYAVVFGCTERWARAFGDLDQVPDWYVGAHPFTVAAFTSSIDHFSVASAGTFTSTPGSSGGSGFGGGGFSGGGGGGGGGGSW